MERGGAEGQVCRKRGSGPTRLPSATRACVRQTSTQARVHSPSACLFNGAWWWEQRGWLASSRRPRARGRVRASCAPQAGAAHTAAHLSDEPLHGAGELHEEGQGKPHHARVQGLAQRHRAEAGHAQQGQRAHIQPEGQPPGVARGTHGSAHGKGAVIHREQKAPACIGKAPMEKGKASMQTGEASMQTGKATMETGEASKQGVGRGAHAPHMHTSMQTGGPDEEARWAGMRACGQPGGQAGGQEYRILTQSGPAEQWHPQTASHHAPRRRDERVEKARVFVHQAFEPQHKSVHDVEGCKCCVVGQGWHGHTGSTNTPLRAQANSATHPPLVRRGGECTGAGGAGSGCAGFADGGGRAPRAGTAPLRWCMAHERQAGPSPRGTTSEPASLTQTPHTHGTDEGQQGIAAGKRRGSGGTGGRHGPRMDARPLTHSPSRENTGDRDVASSRLICTHARTRTDTGGLQGTSQKRGNCRGGTESKHAVQVHDTRGLVLPQKAGGQSTGTGLTQAQRLQRGTHRAGAH